MAYGAKRIALHYLSKGISCSNIGSKPERIAAQIQSEVLHNKIER